MDPAAAQVPSDRPRITNDLSHAGRLVPLTPALEEILNADLPSGIVRREALAAVLPILSVPKEVSETNPLSKKIDPSADLPLVETLIAGLPLAETLIADPPLAETLTVDLPLAAALRAPSVLRVVSGADPNRRKRDPVFRNTPGMRLPRAAS